MFWMFLNLKNIWHFHVFTLEPTFKLINPWITVILTFWKDPHSLLNNLNPPEVDHRTKTDDFQPLPSSHYDILQSLHNLWRSESLVSSRSCVRCLVIPIWFGCWMWGCSKGLAVSESWRRTNEEEKRWRYDSFLNQKSSCCWMICT